jgi:hypothetical protein
MRTPSALPLRALGAGNATPAAQAGDGDRQGDLREAGSVPVGIEYVFVNGVVTVERGRHTGALDGRVLDGPGKR